MSNKYKCSFIPSWLDASLHPEFHPWLMEGRSKDCFRCKFCSKEIAISNMGIRAIKSHMTATRHLQLVKANNSVPDIRDIYGVREVSNNEKSNLQNFTLQHERSNSNDMSNLVQPTSSGKVPSMFDFKFREEVLKAEIVWVLTCVSSHISNRASDNLQKTFATMFTDSKIAQSFGVGKDKISYLSIYGLAPYFKKKISEVISKCDFFSVSYDEALNKIAQRTQMDIHIRYLDPNTNLVVTRYFNSEFLTFASAKHLLESFKKGLGSTMDHEKLISVSMDGPNVNWKFLSLLKAEHETIPDSSKLLEFGSCALHVVHGALKTGLSSVKWDLFGYLRATYYLFKDFPSRRGSYTKVTGSEIFPSKFCLTRWTENAGAVTTAIKIMKDLNKYVNEVDIATSKVFGKVKKYLQDPLLLAKLGFFLGLSSQLEKFLVKFQNDAPLTPFLYENLKRLVKSLMKRILRKDLYSENLETLMEINLNTNENLISAKDFDLFNSAKDGLRKSSRSLTNSEILNFKQQCLNITKVVVAKILQRSPLKYPLTKGMSCLTPSIILTKSCHRLEICLDEFIKCNIIDGIEADVIKEGYQEFHSNSNIMELFGNFNEETGRLDELYNSIDKLFKLETNLKQFIFRILCTFHGNAGVERGFSLNKHCLQDNLHEESLIAKRIINEEVKLAGGPSEIEISKGVFLSCKNAPSLWKEALKKKKDAKLQDQTNDCRKRVASAQLKQLEQKRQKLLKDSEDQLLKVDEEISQYNKLLKNI